MLVKEAPNRKRHSVSELIATLEIRAKLIQYSNHCSLTKPSVCDTATLCSKFHKSDVKRRNTLRCPDQYTAPNGKYIIFCKIRVQDEFPLPSLTGRFNRLLSGYSQTSNISRTLTGNKKSWSLRCSWSIACGRCTNYIFILDFSPGFKGLDKDNCKTRWEKFKFRDLGPLY